jgi:hypothetical protein
VGSRAPGQGFDHFMTGIFPLPVLHPCQFAGYMNQENPERTTRRKVIPVAGIAS